MTAFALTVLLCMSLGCQSAPPGDELPRYADLSDQQVLDRLAERANAIETFRGSGTLTLTDDERGQVTLDAVILAQGNDRLRLRAWKLGRAVFDLTRDGVTVWLWTREQSDDVSTDTEALTSEQLALGWSLISGRLFSDSPRRIIDGTPLTVEYPLDAASGVTARITVDRETVTMTELQVISADGRVRQSIGPHTYRLINGIPIATSVQSNGEGGGFAMRFDDIEINQPLPANAFVPPRDARSQP